MAGFVEGIFLAPEAGAEMKSVQAATALEGCGLEGDRYCAGTGHWSRFGRVYEATFIAAEDLDDIERETGVGVKNGEHRRNVVTRGISLKALGRSERFRVREPCSSTGGRARSAGTSSVLPNRVWRKL
jgi:MOSC domain-containing protein YiiM